MRDTSAIQGNENPQFVKNSSDAPITTPVEKIAACTALKAGYTGCLTTGDIALFLRISHS